MDELGDAYSRPCWIRINEEFSGNPEKGFRLFHETDVVRIQFHDVGPVCPSLVQSKRPRG